MRCDKLKQIFITTYIMNMSYVSAQLFRIKDVSVMSNLYILALDTVLAIVILQPIIITYVCVCVCVCVCVYIQLMS